MKWKNHTKNCKSKVALAAIKGQKTTNEPASEFGIHVRQINRWKKEVIDAIPEIFGSKKEQAIEVMESERDRLYQQVGRLLVEVDWLRKTQISERSITEKWSCINPMRKELSTQR
ncbi:hypothetical protein [Desulfosediminicola flagellatus]|uniref:hypothetical protein n=1 Tax=Desulfosediminicola flagellatus TaxID=2569541 RepID=UPI0010AD8807|nr:hypothetical protein [Desulfosediminicola flagellatus]